MVPQKKQIKTCSMKKLVLALVASFILGSFAVQSVNAQTRRGHYFLTGASQLSFQSTFTNGSGEEFLFAFSPSFGGFIADNLALGLNGKILYSSSASSVSYSAMPTLTYFFNQGKGFIPYLNFQVGYVGVSVRGSSLHGLGMGVGAGGVLMLNKNVGLDLGLQYLHSRYPTRYRNITSNSIATTIGLTTFF